MPYKLYLWGSHSPIEWSQAAWKIGGGFIEDCKAELIHDVLLRHLPKDGLGVDVGCGMGKWPIYLGRAGYRVVGLEISHEICLAGRTLEPTVPMVRADGRQTPLRTGCADAAVSLGVVEHDEAGPEQSLRELRRILKPGGVLVLAVPFNNLFRRLLGNHLQDYVTRKRRRAQIHLGFSEYRFSHREIRTHLAATGFEPIADYPNDLKPPRAMGLWVDRENLRSDHLTDRGPRELFVIPGWQGALARAALRYTPWLVCGEATVVARAV